MTNITEPRDEELGALLRALETPEHGPAFEPALRRQLAEETAAAHRRTRRRWERRAVVVGVAAAAVIATIAVGIPRTSKTPRVGGPAPATASTVRNAVRAAYTSLQNMSGTLIADGKRWRFTLDAAGDFRLEGPTAGEVITYDARLGEARSAQKSSSLTSDTLFYADRTGIAPGAPDQGPPTWLLPEQFGAFVRAALATRDPRVTETIYQARPAWRMDVPIQPNTIVPDASGDHFAITVDQQTGMPVQVVELKGTTPLHEIAIDNLTVNQPLADGVFRLSFPPAADVMRSDDGFERVDLARVAAIVGYEPLVPVDVPAGYQLQEVAVAREAAGIGNALDRPSRMVVSLRYGHGLDTFVVTTRERIGESTPDPFAVPGITTSPQTNRIDTGALAGADTHVVMVPSVVPHLWALTDRLLVTVAGDVDTSQLFAVASSLQRR